MLDSELIYRIDRLLHILIFVYFPFYENVPNETSRPDPQLAGTLMGGLKRWETDRIRVCPVEALPPAHRRLFDHQSHPVYCIASSTPTSDIEVGQYCGRKNDRLVCSCHGAGQTGKRCVHLWAMHIFELLGPVMDFEANATSIRQAILTMRGSVSPLESLSRSQEDDVEDIQRYWGRSLDDLPPMEALDLGGGPYVSRRSQTPSLPPQSDAAPPVQAPPYNTSCKADDEPTHVNDEGDQDEAYHRGQHEVGVPLPRRDSGEAVRVSRNYPGSPISGGSVGASEGDVTDSGNELSSLSSLSSSSSSSSSSSVSSVSSVDDDWGDQSYETPDDTDSSNDSQTSGPQSVDKATRPVDKATRPVDKSTRPVDRLPLPTDASDGLIKGSGDYNSALHSTAAAANKVDGSSDRISQVSSTHSPQRTSQFPFARSASPIGRRSRVSHPRLPEPDDDQMDTPPPERYWLIPDTIVPSGTTVWPSRSPSPIKQAEPVSAAGRKTSQKEDSGFGPTRAITPLHPSRTPARRKAKAKELAAHLKAMSQAPSGLRNRGIDCYALALFQVWLRVPVVAKLVETLADHHPSNALLNVLKTTSQMFREGVVDYLPRIRQLLQG